MLLQRLREYADERLALPPPMYQEQAIRYVINLTLEGKMYGPLIDTADSSSRATQRGKTMLAPQVKRAGKAIKPKLLADTAVYALGVPDPKKNTDRLDQQHKAFIALVETCARATRAPSVQAVAAFLADLDPEEIPFPEDFDPGATLTFRVDGGFPVDQPAVRGFWASVQGADELEREVEAESDLRCIICGRPGPVLSRHPLKIKGIRGGQSAGTDLISANNKAFESYGLANSRIAPTCQRCAERYINALNALLSDEATHLYAGERTYVFWTVRPTTFQPGRMLTNPEPGEVRELISAAETGQSAAVEIDATEFFAVGLSANEARAIVRSWLDTTVGEARRRLARYFMLQELVDVEGESGRPLSIRQLAYATVRNPKRDRASSAITEALMGLALAGAPLPPDVLYLVVRRCRAARRVTRERAVLIKMVLASRGNEGTRRENVMSELEIERTEPAYLCGRLLAVLDAIQQRALGNPNATIVDRYYGTASSAPAAVFGTLVRGSKAHLGKLRKNPQTRGAQLALEQRMEEILAPLSSFPAMLTLQEQGFFALGFYHQRAADRKARLAWAATRPDESAEDAAVDGDA